MEASEQESQQTLETTEGNYGENVQPNEAEGEEYMAAEQMAEEKHERKHRFRRNHAENSNFVHGLSVGVGIGCVAAFAIVWITIFFTPQLPSAITYENMLAIFIYPLIYLLAVGLIAVTAGIVREYFIMKK